MTATAKPRSNRQLTEFACQHLDAFLSNSNSKAFVEQKCNTVVSVSVEENLKILRVLLFGSPILTISSVNDKPVSIIISFTEFFDDYGRPSSTTAERLNGLLDRLGSHAILPQNVRVFRDTEWYMTYLGKGDDKVAVGQSYARRVYLLPNASVLRICGHDGEEQ